MIPNDKYLTYDLTNGPSGKRVNDFYALEINAKVALENGKLVDQSTAIEGSIQRSLVFCQYHKIALLPSTSNIGIFALFLG
ncbi:hypothetical protein [uncultured Nostoc sp.]|uniref:hypothetical protein n=1 Tax=uncultured Nostoc sp. TaxID=340711 RepID=UPI0035C97535